ncbi:MAG: ABC transporter ATP-binding protein [Solirubrobacterales bacterium]|nr:ABC transporter ATP-binding protein [Solirubrobacterales bacterium]MBV9167536.1 ABC transporter ATP-binding protein [Solirubrobacterales bacterium]MBV9535317.1 ABC transporter ATP-binding protein [Solirubrobacterales bacterium]
MADHADQRTASPAIHTVALSKRYGKTFAVNSLSMTVQRGEVFGFLGPNGAGKTTVVKLLLGLARPTGGEGLVLGAPLGDRETRRQIGYLPELFRFQPLLTAREVLRLHCRLLALPKAAWKQQERAALQTIGLLERGDDRVGTFSKGMQQRLGLGVALLGNPTLVVLDEPTSALDPVGRHDVREIIRGLRESGSTVFLNTHLLEEAAHVCDRVAVIDKGRAIAIGALDELLGHHSRVRLKVGALNENWCHGLGRFGRWHRENEWIVVEGIDRSRIADLVDELVALGGRVEAVIPEHQSLEARFLELLGER